MKLEPSVFEKAAKLVDAGWTQRVAAKDAMGGAISPRSGRARCFSLEGALMRAVGRGNDHLPYWRRVHDLVGPGYNDEPGRTPGEVSAKLREIAQAASEEHP